MRSHLLPHPAAPQTACDRGSVTIGTDKLALPVQRVDDGMGLDALVRMIG